MNGLRITLTGATGAIGPHIVAALLSSSKVEQIDVILRSSNQPLGERFAQLCDVSVDAGADPDHLSVVHPVEGDVTDDRFAEQIGDCRNARTAPGRPIQLRNPASAPIANVIAAS